MKRNFVKSLCVVLSAAMLLTGCATWNNTAKGGVIGAAGGAAGGAAIGALIGKLTGNVGVGAAIGAGVGTAVGAGTGVIIGRRMDKAAAAAAAIENAKVETVTDANNLTAVKVTFSSGLMFDTNKYNLKRNAMNDLNDFSNVLLEFADADVAIFGHTDSTGSDQINDPLSVNRANAVADYLLSRGVAPTQLKTVEGRGSKEPVADNGTSAGRAENRRVEIYLYASEAMINAANNGALE
ncbi:MAG: OmpA family protein [Bacteroidaceae bacterium]|nr:OmpA family protein [Bacteroidaceae bacterium]MBR3906608.1 OmpA family protein [Bacteroidaceae bacterium]